MSSEQWALINFRSDKPTQQKKLLYGILVSRGDMNTCAYPFWHVVRRSHFAYTVIHSTLHAPPPAQIATLYWYFQLSQSLLSTPLLRLLLIQWRPGKSRGRREPPPPFPWKFPDLKLGISLSLSLDVYQCVFWGEGVCLFLFCCNIWKLGDCLSKCSRERVMNCVTMRNCSDKAVNKLASRV